MQITFYPRVHVNTVHQMITVDASEWSLTFKLHDVLYFVHKILDIPYRFKDPWFP